ncbi:GGDEF domain-containing protein [Ruminococcus albus]|uniref:Diguanylate cyclase (GGDEF) domain-containing protein n=1 Tax=Ruminococcus albus TaxID=1264 RepID=A0A1H7J531_RUMAL|nr:GGDEF domain-containing protein [Ruminococcus albus]SEK69090.1 diguanylate cyclase (GGDEF) domain-containing protein [Ruminococcus albus]
MYTDQQYKKDLAFIEKIDTKASNKVVFFLYFFPLIACLVAHVLYLVLFYLADIHSMVKFNIGSVSFYALLIILARFFKEKLNLVYASMIEIILHAVAATVCVGLKPDFCMFLLMIIPLAFLVPNKNKVIPFAIMLISVPTYGLLRFIYIIPGRERYDMSGSSYTNVFYAINILIGSFVLIYVALIFTCMNYYYECKARIQNEQLRIMASTDPLTKLNNRREMGRILNNVVNESRKKQKNYIVGIGDIDDFKKINDSYGHDIGDDVLSNVAKIITDNIDSRGYVARWGGEEFLFVLPCSELADGMVCSDNIVRSIRKQRFKIGNKEFSVTMTIGICEGHPENNVEKVISRADSRLYKGKHSGKDRVVSAD